jgi:heme-degrading monooxygenase HmoA
MNRTSVQVRETGVDLEIAIVAAKDGDSAGLVKAMEAGGNAALESVPGCVSARTLAGVENPGNVLFLVEWESVEAHNAGKGSDGFKKFIEIASPWFGGGGGGSMQHFKAG